MRGVHPPPLRSAAAPAFLVPGNWDDACDAVQDALEGVLPRWGRLADSDKRDAYVRRGVVNACLAIIRRRGRSRPMAEPGESVLPNGQYSYALKLVGSRIDLTLEHD